MAVSIEKTGASAVMLTVSVSKADYQGELDQTLKTMRQRADIPGFRRGKAPMSMILKKYGTGAKVEAINQKVGQELYQYINDEKLNVLGEPMPVVELGAKIDFEKDEDFTFLFEAALAPELNVKFSKKDKLPYYHIEASEEMITAHIDQMLNQAGSYTEGESIEENDLVSGTLAELEDGVPKAGGVLNENAMFLPRYVKDEESRNLFLGAGKNAVVKFFPYKAHEGSVAELASFLGVNKEDVAKYEGVEFSFEIKGIKRHVPAELGEEFYKAIFGEEGDVNDEASLRAKVAEGFREQFDPESNFKLLQDLKALIVEKAGKVEYAEDILKRWLLERNEKMTQEQATEELPKMLEDLTYHIVRNELIKEQDIKVEQEDVLAFAQIVAKSQFAQYGMSSVPDEVLENYAKSLIEKKETYQNFAGRVLDDKFANAVKGLVTLEEKTLSPEDFSKLLQGNAEA